MLHTYKEGLVYIPNTNCQDPRTIITDKVSYKYTYDRDWEVSVEEELQSIFSVDAYDPATQAMFNTESDDHEYIIIEPRKGLEDIKKHRWGKEQALHGKMTRRHPRKDEVPVPARKQYDWEDDDPFRDLLTADEPSSVSDEFIEPYALTEYIQCKDDCTQCHFSECRQGQIDWEASQEWILNR